MSIGIFCRAGAFAAAALVAGCGDDGGGNTVALKTEADVTREMSNVIGLYQTTTDGGGASRSRAGVGLALQQRAAQARASSRLGTSAKAETVECQFGTYVVDEQVGVQRELPLFAVTTTMDWYSYDNRDCSYDDGDLRETSDGYHEHGNNYSYVDASGGAYGPSPSKASLSEEAPAYEYLQQGRNGGALSFVLENTAFDDRFTIRSKGRGEYRNNGSRLESREILDFTYVLQADGFREELSLGAGESGTPLVLVDNYLADTFTIDGPFRYHYTDICDGGRIVYATLQPITVSSDASGRFLSAGQLTLTSGGTVVSLAFQADGDITYSIDGGASGEVTRAELQAEPGCGLFIYDSGGA